MDWWWSSAPLGRKALPGAVVGTALASPVKGSRDNGGKQAAASRSLLRPQLLGGEPSCRDAVCDAAGKI